MKSAYLRFYEELNDFLPERKRKIRFELKFKGRTSIKDLIESIGVPHGEVDLILVNDKSVDFSQIVNEGDDISVYPIFESIDITNLQHLREKPLRHPKFVLDVHLGTLAKYMRMFGFDSLYSNKFTDEDLIKISLKESRTILTRDIGILKHSIVSRGYFVRNTKPEIQIEEIIKRFDLYSNINKLSRCLECNSPLEIISKEKIFERLPPKVRACKDVFFICKKCDKIYWQGSHFNNMNVMMNKFLSTRE